MTEEDLLKAYEDWKKASLQECHCANLAYFKLKCTCNPEALCKERERAWVEYCRIRDLLDRS